MDVKFFLKERTDFVSGFFETASAPFSETMRKIRDKQAPFEEPPYDESMGTEPAFLEEYLQAELGIEVVGQTCITLLSESLNLYFKSLARELRVDCEKECSRSAFNKGFIHGYKACFALRGIDWSKCPVRFDVLEQVVLARNDSRHTLHLTNLRVQHSDDTLKKYANPLFVSDYEKELVERMGGTWLLNPTIHMTQSLLDQVIEEITKLAEWLEECLFGSESGQ